MTTELNGEQNRFGNLKAWTVGATGVLLVVPALINAAVDIWVKVSNLPTTIAEKDNVGLFKKHFGEPSLHRGEIPIRTRLGLVKMELEVYDGGDIFVRYGKSSQWFHSPLIQTVSASGLITSAYAGPEIKEFRIAGNFSQLDTIDNGGIIRERFFDGGRKESYKIDTKTGQWSEPQIGEYRELPDSVKPEKPLRKYQEIDISN